MVRAHVGVGFGDALGLGRDMAQGSFQPAGFAGFFSCIDSFQGGFQYGMKVVPHDAFPLSAYAPDDIGVALDLRKVANTRQPPTTADSLM